ncbi:hypothetical protein HK105_205032 [Polyrhizophydium stewartii]|uniref:Rad60/SUMO-like domain-containing protein n=1 Tax=Polyrhizophydium stewartii TaxID=2732419 RepID=A0ABR4N7A1_9FUNG
MPRPKRELPEPEGNAADAARPAGGRQTAAAAAAESATKAGTKPKTGSRATRAQGDFFDLGGSESVSRIRRSANADVDRAAEARAALARKRAILLDLEDDSDSDDDGNGAGSALAAAGAVSVAESKSASVAVQEPVPFPRRRSFDREVSLTPPPADLPASAKAELAEIKKSLEELYSDPVDPDADDGWAQEAPEDGAPSSTAVQQTMPAQLPLSPLAPPRRAANRAGMPQIILRVQFQTWPHSDPTGIHKLLKIKVSDEHQVQLLIDFIASRVKVDASSLVVTFRGARLSPHAFVFDSGVTELDTLVAYTNEHYLAMLGDGQRQSATAHSQASGGDPLTQPEAQTRFSIQVRTASGTSKVKVSETTTIAHIAAKLKLNPEKFEFDGERLDPSQSLADIGIEPDDLIEAR